MEEGSTPLSVKESLVKVDSTCYERWLWLGENEREREKEILREEEK